MRFNRSIIWFRNNLRLQDNEALVEGIQQSSEYILIYIFDEALWKDNPISMAHASQKRLTFLWQSVANLRESIFSLGGELIISKGNPEKVIEEMAAQYNCDAVFAPKEAGVYEQQSEERLEKVLTRKKIFFNTYAQNTLFHEEDIPWPIGKLPDVFTQFRKENEKQTAVRKLIKTPLEFSLSVKLNEKKVSALDVGISPEKPSAKSVLAFAGGEKEAWARLNHYFWEQDQLKNYKVTRNGLLGSDYSSKFSPWLALGCISPKSIYYEVMRYEAERVKNQSTYWLVFELIWRDYFHFVLKKFQKRLFHASGIKEEEVEWSSDEKIFKRWAAGETGVPFVDANMRELNETGYMSNRGRQNVASFLVKDLGIDWRMGAWYFEHALLDYDVASNWGNWAYVAGVGNDPRENRYFNILSQAKKYDPKGDYVRFWLPELKNVEGFNIHKIALLNKKEYLKQINGTKIDYFDPIVDMKKWDY
ncbi:cryptochrome DASH [Marivirga lumbricoides]|uniref:Cryptochrome DASH n=1 Tax=Marivirga lumbricoides TaxID=1046115 RepID=A0ABQ1MGU8_9BACT|nr:cryptochrome DASH [Marivirga lumbricoides]